MPKRKGNSHANQNDSDCSMSETKETFLREIGNLRNDIERFKNDLRKDLAEIVATAVSRELGELRSKLKEQEVMIEQLRKAVINGERQRLYEERRKLSSNVVIRGVPESTGETASAMCEKVKDIFRELESDFPLKSVQRIGKKRDSVDSPPRLIKVTLEDSEQRNEVLKKSKSLRGKEKYSRVYLDSDKTFLDRKEGARMRMRLKELRSCYPTSSVQISRGKLYVNDVEMDHEEPLRHLLPSL